MAQRTPGYPSLAEIQRAWAANLKTARESVGYTLEQAAEALCVRHSTVSRWENQRSAIPDSAKVRLAGLYGASVLDLFPWPSARPPMPKPLPARKAVA